ncbi:MAG: VacJ family lipoprotein [Candidatus Tectomicrobia bacterium]|uniref:VacJ family lipoprotein n=1 Tax=Tectimicrobiota bacterium TaxID=2528274 RepID=A0A932FW74_UNCTE|nr:VacJ family lipoprotein [Candidatus Tectomicrobia bacterium]
MIIVSDPLEPYNRVMYQFNDKFYFWVLKPTAKGYRKVVPEPARKSVRNFFLNLTTPVRLVNNGLQGKFRQSGVELARFFINTTWGVAGLFDPAKSRMNLPLYEEDFDQTLGMYGLGSGIYIIWPFWGPSSLRGTAGIVGDLAMDPVFYLTLGTNFAYTGVTAYRMVNETSLTIGDYESLKEAAIDPYIALRDAYFQNRRGKIKE